MVADKNYYNFAVVADVAVVVVAHMKFAVVNHYQYGYFLQCLMYFLAQHHLQ